MKITLVSEISIDGKLTKARGETSRDLVNMVPEIFSKDIHKQRAINDAILVGANTVRTDNPNLTNRHFGNKQPIRIIISNSLLFYLVYNIFNDKTETIIVTSSKNRYNPIIEKIINKGKKCVFSGEDKVNISDMINQLEKEFGIKSLIIEGGGETNFEFFKEGLIDEIIIYVLPTIIGGKNNVTLVDGDEHNILNNEFSLEEYSVQDNCIRLHYKRNK